MKNFNDDAVFVLCVKNEGCDDLSIRKIYRVLPDEKANEVDYIRVVDDSGEDYLYPAKYFVTIELPQKIRDLLLVAA